MNFTYTIHGTGQTPECGIDSTLVDAIVDLDRKAFDCKSWGSAKMRAVLDQSLVVACTRGNRLIAALCGRLYVHTCGKVAFYINSCAVHPAHQGKGIGRALMRTLESFLRKVGVRIVTLVCVPDVEMFYVRCGYVNVNGYMGKNL